MSETVTVELEPREIEAILEWTRGDQDAPPCNEDAKVPGLCGECGGAGVLRDKPWKEGRDTMPCAACAYGTYDNPDYLPDAPKIAAPLPDNDGRVGDTSPAEPGKRPGGVSSGLQPSRLRTPHPPNRPNPMTTLLHHLRQQALLEGTRCAETRGQDEESIAISSMHAGKAQAYNSVANRLEAGVWTTKEGPSDGK